MCKYSYQCKLCGIQIEVKAEQQNVQDVMVELASECPSLDIIAQAPLSLDAMYELMVPKESPADAIVERTFPPRRLFCI